MTVPAPQRTSTANIPLTIGVAVALLVAAIVNLVASVGFPGNAPVEQVYSFGVTIDLVVAGVILLVRGLVHNGRPRAVAAPTATPTLAIVAVVLGGVALLATLLLGGLENLGLLVSGERLRYMYAAAGPFFLGAAWVLAIIFGVVSFRRDASRLNATLSLVAIAAGFVIVVLCLIASITYGLALTD